jgi:hypothetical protein
MQECGIYLNGDLLPRCFQQSLDLLDKIMIHQFVHRVSSEFIRELWRKNLRCIFGCFRLRCFEMFFVSVLASVKRVIPQR